MSGNEKPAGQSGSGQDEVLRKFLNISYNKHKDVSILSNLSNDISEWKKYVNDPYPAFCVALAKAKLLQIEQERREVGE